MMSKKEIDMCFEQLDDLTNNSDQEIRVHHMDQMILNFMDFTEQTDDEKIWCELLIEFRKLVDKYKIKLPGHNCKL